VAWSPRKPLGFLRPQNSSKRAGAREGSGERNELTTSDASYHLTQRNLKGLDSRLRGNDGGRTLYQLTPRLQQMELDYGALARTVSQSSY